MISIDHNPQTHLYKVVMLIYVCFNWYIMVQMYKTVDRKVSLSRNKCFVVIFVCYFYICLSHVERTEVAYKNELTNISCIAIFHKNIDKT